MRKRLHDRKILGQARKVKLEVNQAIEALKVAGELQATITIETKDGRNFETSIVHAKGDSEKSIH
jgi:VCBS repeat-containing protein